MIITFLRTAWRLLLEAIGENDYDRYRARMRGRGDTPVAPDAFYLSNLERKYSRPNRCC